MAGQSRKCNPTKMASCPGPEAAKPPNHHTTITTFGALVLKSRTLVKSRRSAKEQPLSPSANPATILNVRFMKSFGKKSQLKTMHL